MLGRPDWSWALGASRDLSRVTVTNAVLRTRVSESRGPTVVIIPDPPNVIEHYDELGRELVGKARLVVADAPGFGFSEAGGAFDFSLDAYARAFRELLHAVDARDAVLAFPCVWGYAATLVAQDNPRVRGLALAQAPAWADEQRWLHRIGWRGPVTLPGVGQLALRLGARRVAHQWYDAALPPAHPRQHFSAPALAALEHGAALGLASLANAWFDVGPPALAAVTQPALAFWGGADRSHKKSRAASVTDFVPQARLVRWDDCGHFPELEQPRRWSELVLQQL